jgi:hypothetical protein
MGSFDGGGLKIPEKTLQVIKRIKFCGTPDWSHSTCLVVHSWVSHNEEGIKEVKKRRV